ncbi:DNA -binding domain-containing protein [Sinorhizobium meliloti]|uniref:DNA -binding domain-containing protein n=1 Tax=Rhizobium meliloti TaxID=382 RepID=UPI0039893125
MDRSGELFAFQHADRRSLDWKNAPERRRLYRLLNAAQQLIKDGYRRLLKPDSE